MPFQNFRPLPMRITHKQYERLQAARDYDHLSIQEHVRRSLDFYLDFLEKKQGRTPSLKSPIPALDQSATLPDTVPQPLPPADAAVPGKQDAGKKKLVYR